MITPKRMVEFDRMRGLAILAVITIHSTVHSLEISRDVIDYGILVLLNMLSRFAVPAFLVISGFFITQEENLKVFSTANILCRRIRRIILPYVLWSSVYYGLFVMTGEAFATHQNLWVIFLEKLVTGTVTWQLYFLILIGQYYLISLVGIGRGGRFGKRMIRLSIALQMSFIFVLYVAQFREYFPALAARYLGWFEAYSRSAFPMFVFFFFFGRWLGGNYEIIGKLAKYKNYVSLLLIIFFIAGILEFLVLRYETRGAVLLPPDWALSTNILAFLIIIFLLLHLRAVRWRRVDSVLIWTGKISFTLYLLHEPLLGYIARFFYRTFPAVAASQLLFQPIMLFSGIMGSVLIYKSVSACLPTQFRKYVFG